MIKKLLYGFVAVAGFASCNGDFTDWASPQSNAANEAVSKFTMTVTPGTTSVDFSTEKADSIQLFTTNLTTGQTDGYTVVFAAAEGDASKTITVSPSGKVATADLETVVTDLYGKAPQSRSLTTTVSADVTIATSDGNIVATKSGSPFTFTGTPNAPYISQHYYLIGAPSEWSPTCTTMPFSHSGKDVYDDPTFTVTFPVADGETWFAIADDKTVASGEWSDVLGCAEGNGNNGMEGKIARRSDLTDEGSWKITIDGDAKFVKMTINMMDYSYTLEKINFNEFFYEIGNESGWATNHALYGANYDGKYQGYYYLNGQFKFKPNADNWDGDYEYDGEGKLTQTGSDNIPDPGAGFYQIDVDLTANTYALTKVTSISAIGDFNSWGGDVDLTYNTETGAWEANDVALSGGVKFRMNHEWAVSWGGADGDGSNFNNLTQNNGANLTVEAGTYDIQLYISYEGVNKVVLTKK